MASRVTINTETLGIAWVSGQQFRIGLQEDFVREVGNTENPNPANANLITFTTNATGPTIATTTPADNTTAATGIVNARLTITFNRKIKLGSGNVQVYQTGSPDVLLLNVSTSDPLISLVDTELRITVTGLMRASTSYYVRVDNGAITDRDGFAFTGINNATTFNFTTAASTNVLFRDLSANITGAFSPQMIVGVIKKFTANIPTSTFNTVFTVRKIARPLNNVLFSQFLQQFNVNATFRLRNQNIAGVATVTVSIIRKRRTSASLSVISRMGFPWHTLGTQSSALSAGFITQSIIDSFPDGGTLSGNISPNGAFSVSLGEDRAFLTGPEFSNRMFLAPSGSNPGIYCAAFCDGVNIIVGRAGKAFVYNISNSSTPILSVNAGNFIQGVQHFTDVVRINKYFFTIRNSNYTTTNTLYSTNSGQIIQEFKETPPGSDGQPIGLRFDAIYKFTSMTENGKYLRVPGLGPLAQAGGKPAEPLTADKFVIYETPFVYVNFSTNISAQFTMKISSENVVNITSAWSVAFAVNYTVRKQISISAQFVLNAKINQSFANNLVSITVKSGPIHTVISGGEVGAIAQLKVLRSTTQWINGMNPDFPGVLTDPITGAQLSNNIFAPDGLKVSPLSYARHQFISPGPFPGAETINLGQVLDSTKASYWYSEPGRLFTWLGWGNNIYSPIQPLPTVNDTGPRPPGVIGIIRMDRSTQSHVPYFQNYVAPPFLDGYDASKGLVVNLISSKPTAPIFDDASVYSADAQGSNTRHRFGEAISPLWPTSSGTGAQLKLTFLDPSFFRASRGLQYLAFTNGGSGYRVGDLVYVNANVLDTFVPADGYRGPARSYHGNNKIIMIFQVSQVTP
jgi:hypothetical protein